MTFALGLVTLTDNCFARAMMSIRFLEETLWAILSCVVSALCSTHGSPCPTNFAFSLRVFRSEPSRINVLCGVDLVVHQEELKVLDVADDKGLVAGGHHVLGLLVGAIANLELLALASNYT